MPNLILYRNKTILIEGELYREITIEHPDKTKSKGYIKER
jgi:hypothetical protein